MSKTATVMHLADQAAAPGIQKIEAMQTLHATVSEMRQDVKTALEAFDRITAAQRQSLDEMSEALALGSIRIIEQKTAAIDEAAATLQAQAESMEAERQELAKIPDRLKAAAAAMDKATAKAEALRPRWWAQVLTLMLAAMIGAGIVMTVGAFVTQRLTPADRQELAGWRGVWLHATEQERELMKSIASRQKR
jgi:predicted phage tail protein